jgi:hypothetical protein
MIALAGIDTSKVLESLGRLSLVKPVELSIRLGDQEGAGGISLHFEGNGWKLSGLNLPTRAVEELAIRRRGGPTECSSTSIFRPGLDGYSSILRVQRRRTSIALSALLDARLSTSKQERSTFQAERSDQFSDSARSRICSWELPEMRAFALACLILAVIAAGSAAVLLRYVQESSTTAFAEPSARVD